MRMLKTIRTFTIALMISQLNNTSLVNAQSVDSTKEMTYRPAFHFAPPQNWTNDPNGLVFYNDQYHIFYQYNPEGDTWGHMSWGHATSKDMMKWEHQPVALQDYPNGNGTSTMFFSGTAVVDKNNTSGFGKKDGEIPLVAIYTAHIDSSGTGISQSQSLAYSLDGKQFTRYDKNPLIDLHTRDFRDPKVFWQEQSKQWIMIVAKPLDFKVQLYASPDLKSWSLLSEFGDKFGDKSKIWECPDIFELPVENEPGTTKWVITVSGGHPQQNGNLGMQYFIGNFDGKTFTPDILQYPLYLDYGKDFYAGIIFNNLPDNDKRKIMIGWENSWEYAATTPSKGFRGQMSVPRELSIYKNENSEYRIKSFPVREVTSYRGQLLATQNSVAVTGSKLLNSISGSMLDIEFIIKKSSAEQAGIKLLKHGENQTLVYYNKIDNTLKIDRTKSGNVGFGPKFPSIESVPMPDTNDDIAIRILVDRNNIEVFANGGKQVMTDLVFPLSEKVSYELFSTEVATTFKNINIWEMKTSME
ncbi:glycoside hydrolase family 32 protein [Dyadobacter frigoris]|nr:glycoside hydrolase family 32 protein [Dyadobacter frigoris]